MKEIWKDIDYPGLIPGIYKVSSYGKIALKYPLKNNIKIYKSTNGYVFAFIPIPNNGYTIIPVDNIVSVSFCKCPDELIGKPVKVEHIDGDLRNNHYENLRWVEDIEEWRTITYPGIKNNWYEISNFGNIRRINSIVNLKPSKSNKDYLTINIKKDDDKKQGYLIHRLVAYEFYKFDITDRNNTINHINFNRFDNNIKNLEVINYRENNEHMLLRYNGSNHCDENTMSLIKLICEYLVYYDGNLIKVKRELDKKNIDVSYTVIRYIAKKKTWVNISDDYFEKPFKWSYYITESDVELICKYLCDNKMNIQQTLKDLENIIPDISYSKILHIKYKHTYVNISDKYFKDIKYSL